MSKLKKVEKLINQHLFDGEHPFDFTRNVEHSKMVEAWLAERGELRIFREGRSLKISFYPKTEKLNAAFVNHCVDTATAVCVAALKAKGVDYERPTHTGNH